MQVFTQLEGLRLHVLCMLCSAGSNNSQQASADHMNHMVIHAPQQKHRCGRSHIRVCKSIVQFVVAGSVRSHGSPDAVANPAQKAPGRNHLWGSACSGKAVGFSWELRQSHLGSRPPPRGSGWCWLRRCFAAQSRSTVPMPLHHSPAWHTRAPASTCKAHGGFTNH